MDEPRRNSYLESHSLAANVNENRKSTSQGPTRASMMPKYRENTEADDDESEGNVAKNKGSKKFKVKKKSKKITEVEVTVKKKKKKTQYQSKEMAEKIGREYVLLVTLRDTLYFLAFGIFATVVCFGMVNSSMYQMTKVMQDQILHVNGFDKVNSASKFWIYLERLFSNSFYWDYWYYPDYKIEETNDVDRSILYENKLLGLARLRQLKVLSSSCTVHSYFKRMFKICYGKYDSSYEDMIAFGPKTGTAWNYSPSDVTKTASYWGLIGFYDGGGFYIDLPSTYNGTMAKIEELKNNLWITRGTRVVILDFAVYNANTNLFCVIRVAFEFPPTGGVIPSSTFSTVKLIRYFSISDYVILACELIVFAFIMYYAFEELMEIKYFKWSYFTKFWSYIDLIIIMCGIAAAVLGVLNRYLIHKKLETLDQLTYSGLEDEAVMQSVFNYLLAIKLFCIYIKLFKYLNFNKSMAQLNNTLKKCRKEVSGFALMFFIIFIAFSVLGYLLFGTEVLGFSSFYTAMFTLLRTILGDFNYTDIEKANRVLAPIFFLFFIFLVFFVLLNMFLAIINDTYTDVKTEIAIAPDELQMTGFLRRGYYNFMLRHGCGGLIKEKELQKNEFGITSGEIRGALKRIGFSDIEIEMFFQRFNIDPNAQVQDYDIQKLIDSLEGKADSRHPQSDKGASNKPLVAIDDFAEQQERLDQIDDTIVHLNKSLNLLLERLENLESVRQANLAEYENT